MEIMTVESYGHCNSSVFFWNTLQLSYCAMRTAALFEGKPTEFPKSFCVIFLKSRMRFMRSPIYIAFTFLSIQVQSLDNLYTDNIIIS